MYNAILVENSQGITIYSMPQYDKKIISFMEMANNVLKGSAFILIEGELNYIAGNGYMLFRELKDIKEDFEIFSDNIYRYDEIQEIYNDICNYIDFAYMTNKTKFAER